MLQKSNTIDVCLLRDTYPSISIEDVVRGSIRFYLVNIKKGYNSFVIVDIIII